MQTFPTRFTRRIVTPERRNCPVALLLFGIIYVAVLAVVFAPEGTFIAETQVAHSEK